MSDPTAQFATRQALVNQIFEITGMAVDPDDPVILAALLQATYMQTAANRASAGIRREAEALAVKAEQFGELAKQIQAYSNDRSARFDAIARAVHGIAHDLGSTPAYPGWWVNLLLVSIGSVGGGVVVLAVSRWLGWLH